MTSRHVVSAQALPQLASSPQVPHETVEGYFREFSTEINDRKLAAKCVEDSATMVIFQNVPCVAPATLKAGGSRPSTGILRQNARRIER